MFYSNDYLDRTRKLLNPSTPIEDVHQTISNIAREDNDDITRLLYFHTNSFGGAEADYNELLDVISQIDDVAVPGSTNISFAASGESKKKGRAKEQRENRSQKERAIHRLLTIGVISDYTIEYRRSEFQIKVSGIDISLLVHASCQLVQLF